MMYQAFPVIDPAATGSNILRLRKARGFSVRDLQQFFGFEEPQAIYKWQRGQSLPSVDNLYALSALLGVPMNDILAPAGAPALHIQNTSGRPAPAAHLLFLYPVRARRFSGYCRCFSMKSDRITSKLSFISKGRS